MRRDLILILAAVLLLRLPFLNQPIQGDDVYYLAGAQHAQIDPLHPTHARYAFQGKIVDMRGHPHPPFNVWFLALLLAILGDVYEVPYHAAYVLFSLIAAFSTYALARRFTARPLVATLLFLVVPAFVVNGTSLESDLPFLAFWMAAAAGFVYAVDGRSLRLLIAAVTAMALAAMTAYQSLVLVPILCVYLLKRRWLPAWISLLTIPVLIGAWQLYERFSSGALPAAVLAGYFESYGLQQLTNKIKNAMALTSHTGWLVFPPLAWVVFRSRWPCLIAGCVGGAFLDPHPMFWLSAGTGVLVLAACVRRDFLSGWILIFFAAALILFFAGSARYLLPIAAPVAILASRSRWALPAVACQAALSTALAAANYQHWSAYRQFAASLSGEAARHRVWVNGEWGLRFYLETAGALPLMQGQAVRPGETVVTSELGFPASFTTGGGQLTPAASAEVRPAIPLRLIGLGSRSAFSLASAGFRPFEISRAPADRIRAETVIAREPALSWLPMDAPEADFQIVSGIYSLEGKWRWMSGRGVILLKPRAQPAALEVRFYVPESAPARHVTMLLDGKEVAQKVITGPGAYTIGTPQAVGSILIVSVDQTFSPPGDSRVLGMILTGAGFR